MLNDDNGRPWFPSDKGRVDIFLSFKGNKITENKTLFQSHVEKVAVLSISLNRIALEGR